MKLIKVTNAANSQIVYIPMDHIDSIRYPTVNGNTLVTWTSGDGRSINYEEVKEEPGDIQVITMI